MSENSGRNTITNGNVILVDPNDINTNQNMIDGVPFVNGIPQYQDMFIFAELIAESKGRTVIINNSASQKDSSTPVKVNMMGNNQDNTNDNPNYLNFTTNYYDGSTGNKINYESFGINNIKVTVNSSYVPQVSIQFVDVRGLSFFNQKNSPYRVLFDFPPPIFTLTIKGYYGKALKYKLHLIKYTSEFQVENGNYIINADFVAMTYAPLSDVLLRYIINTPLIDDKSSMNPDSSKPPITTAALIIKLRNLYSTTSDKIKTQPETEKYNNALKQIESINAIITKLNNYVDDENLKKNGIPHMILKIVNPEQNNVKEAPSPQANQNSTYQAIKSTSDYDKTIKSDSTSGVKIDINTRLYIGYIVGSSNSTDSNSGQIIEIKKSLDQYAATLISNLPSSVEKKSIPSAKYEYAKYFIDPPQNTTSRYILLDITDYYVSLYKQYVSLEKTKTDLSIQISNKVNSMVITQLGMLPTVYNIFKIILDDVDKFFEKLKTISNEAENAHNASPDNGIIISDNSYKNSDTIKKNTDGLVKLYSFPLVINSSDGKREERVAPIQLRKLGVKFPELNLVEDFINTFQRQKTLESQLNMRSEQNDDGTYKWIPISPFDSTLGGATPTSPYLGTLGTPNNLTRVYQTLLRRFYILSQGTIPDEYNTIKDNNSTTAYFSLYASAEAVNLASSLATLSNPKYIGLVKISANNYASNLPAFYNDMTKVTDENGLNLYNFNGSTVDSFAINPTDKTNGLVFLDKNNPNFEGVNLNIDSVTLRQPVDGSTNPVDKFNKDAESGWYEKLFHGNPSAFYNQFTQQNIVYLKDVDDTDGTNKTDGVILTTRYLCDIDTAKIVGAHQNKDYKSLLLNGNAYMGGTIAKSASSNLNYSPTNISELWTTVLTAHDKELKNDVIYNQSKLSALILLSNFGYTLGPFNSYPRGLNTLVFRNPAAIEVPTYLSLYVGAIVDAVESGWVNDINNFFTGGSGQKLANKGNFIAADIHDINNYLSVKDKEAFRLAFTTFYTDQASGYPTLLKQVQDLYTNANNQSVDKDLNTSYKILLNPNCDIHNSQLGNSYKSVLQQLITRKNIIVYSQITFSVPKIKYNTKYASLALLNSVLYPKQKAFNDLFFQTFFGELKKQITNKETETKQQKEKDDKLKGDVDIINQLYYSFKNINDKWLSGPASTVIGYPFNENGKNLIDSFAFVDRAMNPIGDTILNAEPLVQLFDDTNVSVYSALSQLLTANGFEFFALQNFMNFSQSNGSQTNNSQSNGSPEQGWEDCFKISTNTQPLVSSAFVCMYIGGTSSYPSDSNSSNSGFANDDIPDISNPKVNDFSSKKPDNINDDELQVQKNKDFSWRQVRAFRVRFGEQNQSMFTDIKIDSKEYTDTNESIQIMARLAGDNKANAATPKGQNLYNLYENRSYKVTITSMGNAMIQPTQYFQLENIPMFSGAYIILSVEHNITGNKMMTTFSGTKISKYPVPRVLSPVAFIGFDGDISELSPGRIVQGALLTDLPQTQYNSMYTLKIS